MIDPNHDDDQLAVPNRVNDSMPADSYAISVALSGELLATGRPRLIGQRTDAGHDALTVLLTSQRQGRRDGCCQRSCDLIDQLRGR